MKEVFEVWLGVFMMLLVIVCGMSVVAASIDAKNADASKTAYIAEIENSNFSRQVMESVFDQADEDGYRIHMTVYHKQSESAQLISEVDNKSQIGDTNDVYMVRLEMRFDYSFRFLNTVTTHTLVGYAR